MSSLKHDQYVKMFVNELNINGMDRVTIIGHEDVVAFIPHRPYFTEEYIESKHVVNSNRVHLLYNGYVVLTKNVGVALAMQKCNSAVIDDYLKTRDDTHIRHCIALLQGKEPSNEDKIKYSYILDKDDLLTHYEIEYLQNVLDTAHFYW